MPHPGGYDGGPKHPSDPRAFAFSREGAYGRLDISHSKRSSNFSNYEEQQDWAPPCPSPGQVQGVHRFATPGAVMGVPSGCLGRRDGGQRIAIGAGTVCLTRSSSYTLQGTLIDQVQSRPTSQTGSQMVSPMGSPKSSMMSPMNASNTSMSMSQSLTDLSRHLEKKSDWGNVGRRSLPSHGLLMPMPYLWQGIKRKKAPGHQEKLKLSH